jgi:periplasmic protein TonB
MAAQDHNRAAEAHDEDEPNKAATRFIVPAVLVLALTAAGYFIYTQMGKGSSGGQKRQTVKIAVLPDTPPPPPPPKEEKKPEPKPEDNKPQPQEQPKQVDTPPEPQQLKMEGAAGDGPSAFGSGTVNSEYKGGPIGTGSGTGGTVGDRLASLSYGNAAKREVNDFLNREPEVRRAGDYKVPIGLWLRADGSVERFELLSSTGNNDTDELLRKALSRFRGFKNPPPPGMAWPMRLQLTNRLTG